MPIKHLITYYTRSPLHIGCGDSVDVVDQPIRRERITNYPIIPDSGIKGPFLQLARETWAHEKDQQKKPLLKLPPEKGRALFGTGDEVDSEDNKVFYAGCVQIMEAKILAFPVRSLCGGFAWITCPSVLLRFQRDTGLLVATDKKPLTIPKVPKEHAELGTDSELLVPNQNSTGIVLEEYFLSKHGGPQNVDAVAEVLAGLTDDPVWNANLAQRIAIISDENFQHFATTCTEVVTRIGIDPATRTVKTGALFNQENVPCETLFYNVCTVHRSLGGVKMEEQAASELFAELIQEKDLILQFGGDATTGHGICELNRRKLS